MLSRTIRRLEKELQGIRKDHKEIEVVVPDDDMMKWRVSFEGPEGSIYAGEKFLYELFRLSFTFDNSYV
jgi:ubiquitin-protein ligase